MPEEKIVEMRRLKVKMKIQSVKNKAKDALHKAGNWIAENKELTIVLISGGYALGMELIKAHYKNKLNRDVEDLKTKYIYNHRTGHYIKMRRAPKDREWIEIDQRLAEKEPLSDILQDMRLL